jgi:preprotein translocase subunit YajC
VFTYVSSVPQKKESAKYINPTMHEVKKGDTIYTNNAFAILEKSQIQMPIVKPI